jgi:GTP-binding protein HflX
VLGEIGAGEVSNKLLLNKADRLNESERESLMLEFPDAILLSAKVPEDVAALRKTIIEFFEGFMVEGELLIPYAKQSLIHEVYENARVVSETYDDEGGHIQVRAEPAALARLKSLLERS